MVFSDCNQAGAKTWRCFFPFCTLCKPKAKKFQIFKQHNCTESHWNLHPRYSLVKSPSEGSEHVLERDVIRCVDFPVWSLGVHVYYVSYEIHCLLLCDQHSQATETFLLSDNCRMNNNTSIYERGNVLWEKCTAQSSPSPSLLCAFLEHLWDNNFSSWQMKLPSKYWFHSSADCWSESWWSTFSCVKKKKAEASF